MNIITIWCFVVLILLSSTLKVLPKEDKETIELCRTMQQRGECPPLLVVFDSREGYFLYNSEFAVLPPTTHTHTQWHRNLCATEPRHSSTMHTNFCGIHRSCEKKKTVNYMEHTHFSLHFQYTVITQIFQFHCAG